VQQASLAYDGGLITIPGVKVYKDPTHLTVRWPSPVGAVAVVPRVYRLVQNYPNPFNASTTIAYELPAASVVQLIAYDLLGREVSVLVNERRDAGTHEVRFDASGLSSGVYLYRLTTGSFVQSHKFLLLR
jgi:hypothetical protein